MLREGTNGAAVYTPLSLGWRAAELFFVGAHEGGVVFKAALLGCLDDGDALGNQGAGQEKALADNIAVNGVAGFFLKFTHHVIFAEKIFPGQGFHR